MNFHPDQMKSMGENEANGFCFAQILWPQAVRVSDSGMNIMVELEVNGAHNMEGMNIFS